MKTRNEHIDRKIEQTKSNIEYNKIELEFAQRRDKPKEAEKYEKRIAEAKKDIEVLKQMKDENTNADS